jgi:hypothetical protein
MKTLADKGAEAERSRVRAFKRKEDEEKARYEMGVKRRQVSYEEREKICEAKEAEDMSQLVKSTDEELDRKDQELRKMKEEDVRGLEQLAMRKVEMKKDEAAAAWTKEKKDREAAGRV